MDNTELVKQVYEHFSEGNVPAVLALFAPDIEWHECVSVPFVSEDILPLKGPDQVVQHVFAQLGAYVDGFHIDVETIFGSGDRVAMAGHYKGVWKATGKEFKSNAAHIWTVRDGKLSRFFQALDTADMMAG